MPLDATATEAAVDAQPTKDVAGRQVVTVTLVFDGVAFDPSALYDALNAAYGTVDSLRDTVTFGTYEFRIS